ncbi:MAG: GIY-YIG nuclease family protein, partial [Beijerinckiaceae bacterium]
LHAMIYSDEAPTLERALHGAFEATRINIANFRKEFFRATIDEVEEAVKRVAPGAPFIKDVEAQEFRETQARRLAALQLSTSSAREAFPATI